MQSPNTPDFTDNTFYANTECQTFLFYLAIAEFSKMADFQPLVSVKSCLNETLKNAVQVGKRTE